MKCLGISTILTSALLAAPVAHAKSEKINDIPQANPDAPLRTQYLQSKRTDEDYKNRSQNSARVLAGSRIGVSHDMRLSEDASEKVIFALESSIRAGTLFDSLVYMLGVQQIRRFRPDGDRARELVKLIALSSYQAKPGTRTNVLCNDQNKCDRTPVSPEEIGALIDPRIKPSPLMNPFRGFTVSTGMASIMSYIAVTDKPIMGLAPDETPEEFLERKQKENPNVDVVRANRAAFRACIKQPVAGPTSRPEDFPLDLPTCARVGSIAAIFNIVQNGEIVADSEAMDLAPLRNLPNEGIAVSGAELSDLTRDELSQKLRLALEKSAAINTRTEALLSRSNVCRNWQRVKAERAEAYENVDNIFEEFDRRGLLTTEQKDERRKNSEANRVAIRDVDRDCGY